MSGATPPLSPTCLHDVEWKSFTFLTFLRNFLKVNIEIRYEIFTISFTKIFP